MKGRLLRSSADRFRSDLIERENFLGQAGTSVRGAYDALVSDRPYRDHLSHEEAVVILQNGAGKQWDPQIVKLVVDEARCRAAS